MLKQLKLFKNEIDNLSVYAIFLTYLIKNHNIRDTNVKYPFHDETRNIVSRNNAAVITLKQGMIFKKKYYYS